MDLECDASIAAFAMAVWENPSDRSEWIYIGSDFEKLGYRSVTRVRIDQPSQREEVVERRRSAGCFERLTKV